MKKLIYILLSLLVMVLVVYYISLQEQNNKNENNNDEIKTTAISNFLDCEAAGNPVRESYPRQCSTSDGQVFTEELNTALNKENLIRVENISAGDKISSPVEIKGEARGYWYFEASFPVELINSSGEIIAQGIATAEEEWMTENFVPFSLNLEFLSQEENSLGKLIFRKDNPSGLVEYDDFLEIDISF